MDDLLRLYEALDVTHDYGIDLKEISPFLIYTFKELFQIDLTSNDVQALFYLIDTHSTTAIDFPEFVM